MNAIDKLYVYFKLDEDDAVNCEEIDDCDVKDAEQQIIDFYGSQKVTFVEIQDKDGRTLAMIPVAGANFEF